MSSPSGKQFLYEFISLECRWFFKQPVPEVIKGIFKNVKLESRSDIYMVRNYQQEIPQINQGIKLREGRLEVKTLVSEFQNPEIPAVIQKWSKTGEVIPDGIDLSRYWLEIPKRRQLIKYDTINGCISGPVDGFPSQGSNVELTYFGSPFDGYFTIGFEAYGKKESLSGSLLMVYNEVMKTKGIRELLDEVNSKSYPEWISGLI